jgi:putative methylase
MLRPLLRKRLLELSLQKTRDHPNPNPLLEQYTIPASLAAEILYIADSVYNDLYDKRVLDLGTGTGRLAIGSLLAGAKEAIGIDLDPEALKVAKENARILQVRPFWILGDISTLRGRADTVLMNPPFGTRSKHADRAFLSKALELAPVTYSLHKTVTREYLLHFLKSKGAHVEALFCTEFKIPWMFSFHRKRSYKVKVDLFRIESSKRFES